MSDGPDESGEWQVVTIGVSRKGEMYTNAPDDEYGANPCRDAKIFAEFTKLICFCSEPVVFAEELKSKPEGDASAFEEPEDDYFEHIDEIMPLQMDLREKLAAGATRMKENNIKNMMVYYAGHGESINKERTASCELKLVLEDEVVRAVEKAKLEHVCVIVLLDSCRDELHKSLYQSPPEPSESNTFRFGYFCQFNHRMRTSSLVLAALMHMMLSETEDSEIVMFFTRLKRVLRDITGGRTDMQLPGTLPDQAFFPAKCRKLKLPFERAKVRRVLEDEEYKALRDTFAMYGHCDCIMDNVYQTGVILRQMLEDTKQMVEQDHKSHLPAFKDSAHTLRYLIPQLQRFAKVFHEKKELFLSDWELELGVVRCKSFEEVLQVLEDVKERAEDPVGSSLRPRCPEVVRKCVVEARHTYSSQEGEQWLMSEKHLKDVFKTLSEYFTPLPPLTSSCVIKEEDEQVPKQNRGFIYELTIDIVAAWCVDGIRASSLTAEQLAQLEHLQNHFTKKDTETNKYETKIYIGAGSIWIMLQLPTLDDRTIRSIHKELEAWTQMLRQSGATWHAARLQKVPQAAVPGGLLKLVRELGAANLATGPVVKLTADHVRELVAKQCGVSPARLHVFEGERSARGWLQRGDLRFAEAEDWRVLMRDMPFLTRLEKLAETTWGGQTWDDSPEFQAAAFLLHHLSEAQVDAAAVLDAAAVAKSPAEFLSFLIKQEFLELRRKDEQFSQARRCWLERFVASTQDLQPSLYGAFILPDLEEGQKCAECFEQLMKLHLQDKRKNWGAVARKECGNYANSIMKAHGKAKPFGLELDELFALVAYAYDHPPAPPSANLWALLGSLVRERQLQEAGLFLRYFQQAVEKRTQRQPEATFLYCGMPEMNLTLEEGMYIYWRTFTSWTRHFQVARSAGAGVIRLTAHWVCEISEFSEYCVRNCVSEVILRPNQVLKVVACPGISEGHDIALDLLEEEEEEEESPF